MATTREKSPRQRVPASERRDALIEAAMHEFAQGGLHGTPVDRIARRVGVAQPYVFSLFGSKKELFLAAVDRGFQQISAIFDRGAAEFDPAIALPEADATWPIANAYLDQLEENRDVLLLQHQAYAACGDEEVQAQVRGGYDAMVVHLKELTGVDDERADEFFRYGMWINVNAALGRVEPFCERREWVRPELRGGAG
jgi:AcrR family transcriptional regulator